MKEKCNFKFYKIFSKITKFIRDHFSDDPLEPLKKLGNIGLFVANGIAKLLGVVIHVLSYMFTKLFYNRKKDDPCKGSLMYTIANMGIKKLIKTFVVFTLALTSMTQLVSFLSIDIFSNTTWVLKIIEFFS